MDYKLRNRSVASINKPTIASIIEIAPAILLLTPDLPKILKLLYMQKINNTRNIISNTTTAVCPIISPAP
jgi:hypothetical protein